MSFHIALGFFTHFLPLPLSCFTVPTVLLLLLATVHALYRQNTAQNLCLSLGIAYDLTMKKSFELVWFRTPTEFQIMVSVLPLSDTVSKAISQTNVPTNC